MDVLGKRFRAPEIYGDFWFNSEPIPIAAMRGYVILIDFWDCASQDSLRAIPYLNEWHRRYAEKGLVMIGVHTPQFPFARDPIRVHQAIGRAGIHYPVVMDNDFIIWSAFRSRVWPTKHLIDKDGFIRYVHAGEGSYQNFEHAVQSLLVETGFRDDFPLVMEPLRDSDSDGAVRYRPTPEILAGYQHGEIGNVEGYSPESTMHYEDPGYYLEGRIYLHGNWMHDRHFLKLDDAEGQEGYLVIRYQAKEVNAVIEPVGEELFQVFVHQDDQFLTGENKGDDIHLDEEGRSFILVDDARLFSIVKNREYGEHKLKMMTRSNGFALYSVSFVSSVIPEMVSNN